MALRVFPFVINFYFSRRNLRLYLFVRLSVQRFSRFALRHRQRQKRYVSEIFRTFIEKRKHHAVNRPKWIRVRDHTRNQGKRILWNLSVFEVRNRAGLKDNENNEKIIAATHWSIDRWKFGRSTVQILTGPNPIKIQKKVDRFSLHYLSTSLLSNFVILHR